MTARSKCFDHNHIESRPRRRALAFPTRSALFQDPLSISTISYLLVPLAHQRPGSPLYVYILTDLVHLRPVPKSEDQPSGSLATSIYFMSHKWNASAVNEKAWETVVFTPSRPALALAPCLDAGIKHWKCRHTVLNIGASRGASFQRSSSTRLHPLWKGGMDVITPRLIGTGGVILIDPGDFVTWRGLGPLVLKNINHRLCPIFTVPSSKPDYLHFIPKTVRQSHDTRYHLPSSIHIPPFDICIYFSSPT